MIKMENINFKIKKLDIINANRPKENVKTLQHLCRATVLSSVTLGRVNTVRKLEIPNVLKDFLSSFNIPDDFDLDGFYIEYHCNFPNHVHHKVHQIHPGRCLIDSTKVLIKSQHLSENCRTCESSGKCVMNSLKEREVWQRLRHKNLMSCLASIKDPLEKRVCLVFEFPGITLQDFVFRMFLAKRQIPEIVCWQVLLKLTNVLIYLDNNGIIPWELCHPQNVVITNKGEVKLENLLLYLPMKSGSRYQTNTAKRLSPEQIEGDKITSKTIVWALGRILYEISARFKQRNPLVNVSSTQLMCYNQAINCTRELCKLTCECLRNDPDSRPSLSSLKQRTELQIQKLQACNYDLRLENNLLTLMRSLDRLPFSGGFLR
ncbi:Serine/threonine-protein kinase Nek2 [Mactra antiquata]